MRGERGRGERGEGRGERGEGIRNQYGVVAVEQHILILSVITEELVCCKTTINTLGGLYDSRSEFLLCF